MIKDVGENIVVSFLFQESICFCSSLVGFGSSHRSHHHVIVELADAGYLWFACAQLMAGIGIVCPDSYSFGSFGFGRRGMPGRGGNPVHEKWMHMTPEQRREFIKKRKHMGFGPWDRERFFDREDFGRNTDADFGKSADVTQGKDVHIAPSVKNE